MPQQRARVGRLAEVTQLVRVDDPSHGLDLAVGDVERHHADQLVVGGQEHRAGLAVQLDSPHRDPAKPDKLRHLGEPADTRALLRGASS